MKRYLILATTVVATGLLGAGALYWKLEHPAKAAHEAVVGAVPGHDGPGALSLPSGAAPSIVAKQSGVAGTPKILGDLPMDENGYPAVERIHALGCGLSEKDQGELAAWIQGSKPARYSAQMWLFVRNEVMDKLGAQRHPSAQWGDELAAIVRDKSRDAGLRDYAIQHLGEWIEPAIGAEPCEKDAKRRGAMVGAMLDAARDYNGNAGGDVAGTALLDLSYLLDVRERAGRLGQPVSGYALDLSAEQLRPMAVGLASDAKASVAGRVTAMQVCARQGFGEALPTARRIAADKGQPFMLRLAAIAALGQLGEADDEAILESVVAGGDANLLKAAQPALQRLRARNADAGLANPGQS